MGLPARFPGAVYHGFRTMAPLHSSHHQRSGMCLFKNNCQAFQQWRWQRQPRECCRQSGQTAQRPGPGAWLSSGISTRTAPRAGWRVPFSQQEREKQAPFQATPSRQHPRVQAGCPPGSCHQPRVYQWRGLENEAPSPLWEAPWAVRAVAPAASASCLRSGTRKKPPPRTAQRFV